MLPSIATYFSPLVADVVVQEIADSHAHGIRQHRFHALLRAAGTVHRNSRAQPQKENRSECERKDFDRDVIRNRNVVFDGWM